MAPTPSLNSLQPFKSVRDNWTSIKPYHDNYLSTISFANVITAFLGTLSMVITHGLKMPRLHPMMEVDDLEPSQEHPDEYVTDEDLTNAKLYEFEFMQEVEMRNEILRQIERAKAAAATAGVSLEEGRGDGQGEGNQSDEQEISPSP
jgi:hypothetical protein